ncbi:hypothetical protein SPF06_21740 [Sinomonas sp. JGH33]|uniref:Uncharacterized protein n=1 Tax=Sinomonas terricola TaxID=3110330 RepID=A0ABU5TD18_9MICC|nr:hypothetical protein [Sinomonas sp. JGH33]MEA5457346.1 hypothetical protein [Sinomonas sp. JGH33]
MADEESVTGEDIAADERTPADPETPVTAPNIRKITLAWLAALVLAIIAAVAAIILVQAASGPAQPVRAYLSALQAGDGARALGALRAQVPPGSAAMLDGAPLRDSMSRIHELKVGQPHPAADGRQDVSVTFTSDGASYSSDFLVEQTGTDWLFFPRWSIVPGPLPTVDASVINSSRATLNGAAVNMPSGRNSFPVFYPGSYVGALPGEYFAADAKTAVVAGRGSQPLSLETKATPALNAAIAQKAKEFLDQCAQTASSQQRLQPDCPFSYATGNRIVDGTIAWSVTQYPSATVTPFNGQWAVAPLSGKAKLTAQQIDLFTGKVSELDVERGFTFTVRLDVSGTTITLTPVIG